MLLDKLIDFHDDALTGEKYFTHYEMKYALKPILQEYSLGEIRETLLDIGELGLPNTTNVWGNMTDIINDYYNRESEKDAELSSATEYKLSSELIAKTILTFIREGLEKNISATIKRNMDRLAKLTKKITYENFEASKVILDNDRLSLYKKPVYRIEVDLKLHTTESDIPIRFYYNFEKESPGIVYLTQELGENRFSVEETENTTYKGRVSQVAEAISYILEYLESR